MCDGQENGAGVNTVIGPLRVPVRLAEALPLALMFPPLLTRPLGSLLSGGVMQPQVIEYRGVELVGHPPDIV